MMNVMKYNHVTNYGTVRHMALHFSKFSIMANGMVERKAQQDKIKKDKETQNLNLYLTYSFKRSKAE